jgi:hypothetical protein
VNTVTEDSLGPLLGRLRRTVVRFGDERDDRLAIDSGEGAMGELTWADLRRLDRLLRWAERTDQAATLRRLEAADREHWQRRRWLASLDVQDLASPDLDIGAEGGDVPDP